MVPRRIVVTGASGNVGTALLRRLDDGSGGYDVHGIARRHPPPVGAYRNVHWHAVDLSADGAAGKLEPLFRGADCVVHLAWGFQPTRDTAYLDRLGVGGSRAVLATAHDAEVPHLVHMSSVGAYAAGRYGERVDESWSTAGVESSAYSRAKAAVEAMLDDYERRHPGVMAIARMRPGLVLQHDAASAIRRYTLPGYLDPRWLRRLPVFPVDRSLVVPVVHADDVAAAIVAAIERRATGAFNLAADPPVRRDDIARRLGARPVHIPESWLRPLVALSWRLRLQPIDEGWFDLAFEAPLLDTTRAREELGWAPQWSSDQVLDDIGRGFVEHAGTASPILESRSATTRLRHDLADGPITTRPEP